MLSFERDRRPLSTAWGHSLGSCLIPPLSLLAVALAALAIDLPLARLLVAGDALSVLDTVFEAVETFGHATGCVIIVMAVAVFDPDRRRTLPRLLACSIGAGLLADLGKLSIGRIRPYDGTLPATVWDSFQGLLPALTGGENGHGFPSAHMATATGLAVALTSIYPRARHLCLVVVLMVGLQRVETGAHYLSDVAVGAALGWLTAGCMFHPRILGRLFDNFELPPTLATTSPAAPETAPEAARAAAPQAPAASRNPPPTELPSSIPLSGRRFNSLHSVSAVIPVFNEEENVPRLYATLEPVLAGLGIDYEILFVNDGSRDNTPAELDRLASRDPHVRVIHFRRNFGQTAAMSAGLKHASGDAIVLLDGDLQNDPTDIPMMLARLDDGFDLVHGWRKDRHDRFLDRRLPSLIANRLISYVTAFPVHDLGCTLKVLRREVARELRLYGEMHRFIPILAHCRGARCTEVVTRHHARQFGTSKYGIGRTFRVLLDLITVKFLTQYLNSPMRYFGQPGLASIACGLAAGLATLVMKLVAGIDMTGNPLLLCSVFGTLLGMQFLCLGVLGEVAIRTYYEAQDRDCYTVRSLVNFPPQPARQAA